MNTDAANNSGISYDELWFDRSRIATSGGPAYRRQCELIRRGDVVLVYVNGTGVVAAGVVLDDMPEDVRQPNCLSPVEPLEFQRQVSWFADLRGAPVSHAIIKKLRGAGPTRAVTRLDVGEDAVLQEIDDPVGGAALRDRLQIGARYRGKPTVRQCLMDARIGQGQFCTEVLARWENRCAVSGTIVLKAVRASHVLPWASATDLERLDPDNGLPLVATLDALFDHALISFDQNGGLLVSLALPVDQRFVLAGACGLRRPPNDRLAAYLAYHCSVLMSRHGAIESGGSRAATI